MEPLTVEDRKALFALVRDAIRAHLLGEPPPLLPEGSPALRQRCGAFVTLRRKEDRALRGCIGHIVGRAPLAETVRELAVSAAFHDRRFPPLTLAELGKVTVELSVLSPLEPAELDAIEVGRHGLLVRLGPRSGLLLPEVARERGWTPAEFLAHTCVKAGLPPDAWRDPRAEVLWFTSDHYSEDDDLP